ncbi:hypothetical protein NEOLEDRAFT_119525 [Neolentinus lepideus HHB14362 ss-1]|uniref:Uncharacterized protein n=1 Tax=Neolentinus lepideus HHB14362 ss-1 TaxID=1314782 RepID=A0A165MU55_9AGAM|nr:hypothetical protein NEOLEDRAFT_119525 [Neolentinus lepideus HHB14362 ss-1]
MVQRSRVLHFSAIHAGQWIIYTTCNHRKRKPVNMCIRATSMAAPTVRRVLNIFDALNRVRSLTSKPSNPPPHKIMMDPYQFMMWHNRTRVILLQPLQSHRPTTISSLRQENRLTSDAAPSPIQHAFNLDPRKGTEVKWGKGGQQRCDGTGRRHQTNVWLKEVDNAWKCGYNNNGGVEARIWC